MYGGLSTSQACPESVVTALIISLKSGLREAPPTKKPSISGWEINSAAFFELTEPPY